MGGRGELYPSLFWIVGIFNFAKPLSSDVIPKNGILRRTNAIFRPVTFLVAFRVVLVAFGVVLVAPRTGRWVTVAYESRARWRSPRQRNHNDVLVSSSRRADNVTRERRREGLGPYVTIVLL